MPRETRGATRSLQTPLSKTIKPQLPKTTTLQERRCTGADNGVYQDLLLLLEQILKDQRTPDRAACVHECTALAELAQLYGSESELIR